MEIIKKGIDPATIPVRGTCTTCGTIIEGGDKEWRHTNDQRDGDSYAAQCPVCKKIIYGNKA